MKPFMNAQAKQTFIMLSAAGTAIGTCLDAISPYLPKDVVADLKRSRTYLTKALTNWMRPMPEKDKGAVLRQAAGVNLGVISDASKKREQMEYVRYIRDVRMKAYEDGGRDYILDLCEHTMATVCRSCDGKCRDSCPLYDAYQKFDIEFWNANHPTCEYSGAGAM